MSGGPDIAWARGVELEKVASPALLISVEAVRENIRRMIAMAGDPARLWPHVKTHKQAWIVQEHLNRGVKRFKCATIAEAELTAQCGATDVLLAMQPVGPQVERLLRLAREFPATTFSTVADDAGALRRLEAAAAVAEMPVTVLLDIDVGQQRTGVAPGSAAAELYRQVARSRWLRAGGLHVYDGHLHQTDAAERARATNTGFAPVVELRQKLEAEGLAVPRIVAGGTPTFPIHAARPGLECSPGTCVLWDAGYAAGLPDLDFVTSAALLTRVVSKPAQNRITLDAGTKAVASEMTHPRVVFPDLPGAKPVAHNEEHLVLETVRANEFQVGDALLGVPWHVCPTVALHAEATLVENGRVSRSAPVAARARRLTV